jgi:hypothetical protein
MYLTLVDNYDTAWSDLNKHLEGCEMSQGSLSDALCELETHQKGTGFIQDGVNGVIRVNYVHSEHPFRYLQVQFNPKRALRFRGSGINLPPEGVPSVNDGCFLCRENILWQQQGKEFGYEIAVNGDRYYAWMNPFPLLPCHVVIATTEHTTQEWEFHPDGRLSLEQLVGNLVALAGRMPGFIGFYNGINAGASIPGHMHYQFCKRPEANTHFPLEQAERDFTEFDSTGIIKNYPLSVAVWHGPAETVVARSIDWIRHWAAQNDTHLSQLTANIIATADPETGEVSLYFAPRDRNRSRSKHMSGLVGGLEVMGELVFSSEEEGEAIGSGNISYQSLLRIYQDIYTPFYLDSTADQTV